MILLIGLGNPGKIYHRSRHNVGRLALEKWQKNIGFPNFKYQKKFDSLITRGVLHGKKIILSLPETFMNFSGKAVQSLVKNYKIKIQDIWVLHDDIDLPLGKVRIVKNRGAAGHKGVQSIINKLLTKDFIRFRIGIQPQEIKNKKRTTKRFVLQSFNIKESETVKEVVKKTHQAVESALKEDVGRTMQKYNS